MAEEKRYKVITTIPAKSYLKQEILPHLLEHFSLERAEAIYKEILEETRSLKHMPNRGRIIEDISVNDNTYRFLLYKNTKSTELKIVYRVDQAKQIVYIHAFYPTKRDPETLLKELLQAQR